jgi:ornithine carbamoyltransferase
MSTTDSKVRHFLELRDVSPDELRSLIETGRRIKLGEVGKDAPLQGKSLGLILRKHSTRTRVSFDVGMYQLGGHSVFLSDRDSQMGRGESIADTARVLSRYLDAIMIRTYSHDGLEEMAANASIPIINGLTDWVHPCQLLAELLTLREEFGDEYPRQTVAWVGDGNNVANSWINAAGMLGFELRLAIPEGYDPDPEILARAQGETSILLTRDPAEAVEGASVVTTDTWASMGQEEENELRSKVFSPFQVDSELMERARSGAIFLHCLPAYRGKEVTAEVIDGPRSRIFDEAENRLHSQKALLLFLMGGH